MTRLRRASMTDAYTPMPGGNDLARPVARGPFAAAWQPLMAALDDLGADNLADRWDRAQMTLRDHGVTYNVHGDPQGRERPWELGAIPVVLDEAEWSGLAAGLAARARLFDRILADLYGPQDLVARGLIAPAVVHAHGLYPLPVRHVKVPGETYLHVYAADVIKGPDGRWYVVNDRTEAPIGLGYALENRILIGRVLAEPFRNMGIARLAPFFAQLKRTLARLAPADLGRPPRVVILTPGPQSPSYFEHTFLSRYLGITLVEGRDLTVREDGVYLKTVGGLEPVDVIWRRINSQFADPLELRGDSLLGVPGLLEAARGGTVVLANALGSGLVESQAILPQLSVIAAHLGAPPPVLPGPQTVWCAGPGGLDDLGVDDPNVVVKPVFNNPGVDPDAGRLYMADGQDAARAAARIDPALHVVQHWVTPATAPVWQGHRLTPRPVVLRLFLVSDGAGGYVAMPGALVRFGGGAGAREISIDGGAGSKDLWVTSAHTGASISLLSQGRRVEPNRAEFDLTSRVGDGLFWLGRYAERAETVARSLRHVIGLLADGTAVADPVLLATASRHIAQLGAAKEVAVAEAAGPLALERVLIASLSDPDLPNGLAQLTERLRAGAFALRDRLSEESWRVLRRVGQALDRLTDRPAYQPGALLADLDELLLRQTAFGGIMMENMVRGPGWHLLDLGRRLERADALLHLIEGICRHADGGDSLADRAALDSLLALADSTMTYRNRHQAEPQINPVLDVVMDDATNPRSLTYLIQRIANAVAALPGQAGEAVTPEKGIVAAAREELAPMLALDVADAHGFIGDTGLLLLHAANLRGHLYALANAVTRQYLTHAAPMRTLADARRRGRQGGAR